MKHRIIEAFAEELKESGIKLTMDDLARRLGISKRTLYEHFSSKAEILDALIEETFSEVDNITEQILNNSNLTLVEKIKGVINALPTHKELYDRVLLEQIKRSYPEQWSKVSKVFTEDWNELQALIEQGIHEGVIINKNATLIVKLIREAIQSVHDQRFYMQNNISTTEAVMQITDIILFGLISKEK
ncbi:TetR family transcriptional regulator [Paenibacillus sp. 7541]|uniref:TetR family transcriptional regulator n=1 Tax=Paenibacillus campinasensis TaxID=66347 RepID=A0A268EHU1_9BACL|nr:MULTISPECIES: TetR/AcrR family transcriptional regulator [Paenibacillus]PAD72680.1 TetR family transcriptional regulator [Paenibacillus campinasensis]PAK51102.1 TetR family transcriptional regulator [Paenibacillus sp. 7541]